MVGGEFFSILPDSEIFVKFIMPVFKIKNEKFFKQWAPEMAYVMGFFAADGSMTINPRGSHYVEFYITDKDLLETIREIFQSNHKIAIIKRNDNWNKAYRLQIGSKAWFNDLLKLGFVPNKAKRTKLPKIPHQYIGDFVRGYFDGDGCVSIIENHKHDRPNPCFGLMVRFISGSENFLQDLKLLLTKHNIDGSRVSYGQGAFRLTYSTRSAIKLYNLMYASCKNLLLERKRKIFEKFLERFHGGRVV